MDWLLHGGLQLPESEKPLLMLISGPPGSGKTTFALELCYRLASQKYASNDPIVNLDELGNPIKCFDESKNPIKCFDKAENPIKCFDKLGKPIKCFDKAGNLIQCFVKSKKDGKLLPLYLSGDTEAKDLTANAVKLGWKKFTQIVVRVKKGEHKDKLEGRLEQIEGDKKDEKEDVPILLWGKSDLPKFVKTRPKHDKGVKLTFGIVLNQIFGAGIEVDKETLNKWAEKIKNLFPDNEKTIPNPDILVLDSLNIIKNAEEQDDDFMSLYAKLMAKPRGDFKLPKLVVVVADTLYERTQSSHMAYLADVVIRLDYDSRHDYFTRYIEIQKARFQGHVLGKHYFKIRGKWEEPEAKEACNRNILIQRSHPYRKQGGIFICPSIHSYLSDYRKTSAPPPTGHIAVFGKEMEKVFEFPRGRCTTFIGDRGAHKSHFAYTQLLDYLENPPEGEIETAAIVVSLREDADLGAHIKSPPRA